MTAPVISDVFVSPTSLRPGLTVRYGGDEFRVAEVLPVAVLGGWVVIAFPVDAVGADSRVALVYACEDALAELVGGGA